MNRVCELVKHAVINLVDKPENVSVHQIEALDKKVIQVKVAPRDLQHLIGREGNTFRALRNLVVLYAGNEPFDIVVDVAE